MSFSIIVASTEDLLIGKNNTLPWHLPEDLKFFKATTTGHKIIMGRNTYDSIGKALPNRTNIVLSRDPQFHPEGILVYNEIAEVLTCYQNLAEEIFIIGGTRIYEIFLPYVNKIYHTKILNQQIQGDSYFPKWDYVTQNFSITQNGPIQHSNVANLDYQMLIWQRL